MVATWSLRALRHKIAAASPCALAARSFQDFELASERDGPTLSVGTPRTAESRTIRRVDLSIDPQTSVRILEQKRGRRRRGAMERSSPAYVVGTTMRASGVADHLRLASIPLIRGNPGPAGKPDGIPGRALTASIPSLLPRPPCRGRIQIETAFADDVVVLGQPAPESFWFVWARCFTRPRSRTLPSRPEVGR